MKYHLSAMAAIGALAAVSFAAPASAGGQGLWMAGDNELVCQKLTLSAPKTDTNLVGPGATSGNITVSNKKRLVFTFNFSFPNTSRT